MQNGWIPTWRVLSEKAFWKKSQYAHLWIHILIKASHTGSEFLWNKETIRMKPGQFLTGRKELSIETGIPEGTIEDILNYFEKEQQIQQQKTTKFRVITVKNWNKWQVKQQQSNNRATTEQQQADTYKKDKKDKNDKKGIISSAAVAAPQDPINHILKIFYDSINPQINFGNTTQRKAAAFLVERYGLEETVTFAKVACRIQGQQFSPVITSPIQLKDKLAALQIFIQKASQSKKGAIQSL